MTGNLDVLFTSEETKKVELEFKGQKIELILKELSWSKKNQILSRCFTYQSDGSVSFNLDRYLKDALCEIIVNAPWGQTTSIFLTRVNPTFGAMLEKLVPKAFEENQVPDFFGKEQST